MTKQKWTAEQQAAISTRDCNLLVAAAAGAGKTAVLVERIIKRICNEEAPVDVDRLLVVTFTNAAAAEMRERIARGISRELAANPASRYLGRQLTLLNRAPITTLHSFCLELLRQNFYRLEIDPAFRIADDNEAALLRLEVLEELFEQAYAAAGAENPFTALVESYGGERDDQTLQEMVLKIDQFAGSNPWPEAWLQQMAASFNLAPGAALDDLCWTGVLKETIDLELQGAAHILRQALTITGQPGAPEQYRDNLQADLELVENLRRGCAGSWEDLHRLFQGLLFGRLKSARGEVDQLLKEQIKNLRDQVKDKVTKLQDDYFSCSPGQYCRDITALAPLMTALSNLVIDFRQRYRRAKLAKGLVDFNDLEHYCLELLLDRSAGAGQVMPSPLACSLREKYVEVLVDEYQDINAVQECILQLLSRQGQERPNLFMVGDVKQSIYRFRLAEPGLFLAKYRQFPDAAGGPARKINLTKNFRSRPGVVAAVNFIFRQLITPGLGEIAYDRQAELVYGADYYPAADREGAAPEPVEVHLIDRSEPAAATAPTPDREEADTTQTEARLIARRIEAMRTGGLTVWDQEQGRSRPVTYRDMVVLLRATRDRANIFLQEFRRQGIPAYAELTTGYFEATEVETILSLLKVIDNPRQDIPLAGVLRSPLVGLTEENLAEIRLCRVHGDFYSALTTAATALTGAAARQINRFLGQLDQWRTLARRGALTDLIWLLYRETGFYDYAGGMAGGAQRQANLRALHDRARQFEATASRGLYRFLRFIERVRQGGGDMGTARSLGEKEDVVRIMSIHKSKGLEFPVVFVAGLGNRFNLRELSDQVLLHRELGLGPQLVDCRLRVSYPTLPKLALRSKLKMEALAEELRVLYVALTRARERLILVGSIKNPAKVLAGWCRHDTQGQWPLPRWTLAGAGSFLDWLGPALARHPDGALLYRLAGWPEAVPAALAGDDSRWSLSLQPAQELQLSSATGATVSGELLDQVKQLKPVALSSHQAEIVNRCLSWQYPGRFLAGKSAKAAVTEVKRRFDLLNPAEYSDPVYLPELVERPRFLQDTGGLSGAEIGTAMHGVMQQVDLQEEINPGRLKEQLAVMVSRELLTAEQAAAVDVHQLISFFDSALGQRLRRSTVVYRELPFSLAVPVQEIYPDLADLPALDDTVLVQGVIDCLFAETDGLVLIDYKSDRVDGDRLAQVAQRYRGQLNLYTRAVETILKQPVKERWLYLFRPGAAMQV